MRVVVPVILSGGSGTRLWPLSRPLKPKQFLPLTGDRTLFQETVLRTRSASAPLIVCNEAHRFLVAEQLRELGVGAQAVLLEPIGRNTAAAVAAAALVAVERAAGGDEPILAVFPSDHVIGAPVAFLEALRHAVDAAASGRLVTFGVVPDRPETGYGYIQRGAARGPWSEIDEFVEKPDEAAAERYVSSGRYLWNSGMFVFRADAYLRELARHAPRILDAATRAVAEAVQDGGDFLRLGAAFADSPAISIDYALMEKTDQAAVVPLDAGWSDVGSWAALHDVLGKDAAGNVLSGDVLALSCRNSYVRASGRLVAVLGLDGVVVVETPDAILVMSRDEAQNVKLIVERLASPAEKDGPGR